MIDEVVIVVLGASGDLAKKKTYPALLNLFIDGLLPQKFRIIGYARSDLSEDEFKKRISGYFKVDNRHATAVKKFLEMCSYIKGQYDTDDGYRELNQSVETFGIGNRLFYLALPPAVFGTVSKQLRKHVYTTRKDCFVRVIIEKPFGHDLESSEKLQAELAPIWKEKEVYRIDHYLGKEIVKNILTFRFDNPIFEELWNGKHIESVNISFKEPFGTEGRGGYFNDIGIIRDVMQNHLLQILSLVAMERPKSASSEDIRDEKVKLLKSVKQLSIDDTLLGQYAKSSNGAKPAYIDDDTVPKDSRTVTYAAINFTIQNVRWTGVPFVLTAGKALDEGIVEVRIKFKQTKPSLVANELVFRVQPNESIFLNVNTKLPGLTHDVVNNNLQLSYKSEFPHSKIPDAYASLILDSLNGEQSNFVRDDELNISWKLFTPLLHRIDNDKSVKPELYPYGSTGPKGINQFFNNIKKPHSLPRNSRL